MSLRSAIVGKITGEGESDDFLTDYTKKRLAEEEAKKKRADSLSKGHGGKQDSGKEAILALNDEYETD